MGGSTGLAHYKWWQGLSKKREVVGQLEEYNYRTPKHNTKIKKERKTDRTF